MPQFSQLRLMAQALLERKIAVRDAVREMHAMTVLVDADMVALNLDPTAEADDGFLGIADVGQPIPLDDVKILSALAGGGEATHLLSTTIVHAFRKLRRHSDCHVTDFTGEAPVIGMTQFESRALRQAYIDEIVSMTTDLRMISSCSDFLREVRTHAGPASGDKPPRIFCIDTLTPFLGDEQALRFSHLHSAVARISTPRRSEPPALAWPADERRNAISFEQILYSAEVAAEPPALHAGAA